MVLSSVDKQQVLKLDLTDKKLLFYLSQDSRWKRKALGKKLHLSVPNLNYRIERLIKNEVIEPVLILNIPHFGLKSYILLVDRLNEKIENNDSIYFLCQTVGKYNYVLHVVTENLDQFLLENLSNSKFEIYELIKYFPDNYNPFSLNIKPLPNKRPNLLKLDKKDYQLLVYLCSNPLASILKISSDIGLDRQTIKKKISNLIDNNYIQKFRYILNIFRLGFSAYFIKIDSTPNEKEKIINHVRMDNYAGFIFESYISIILWYIPPSHRELLSFIESIEKLSVNIKIEVIQIAEIVKLTFLPQRIIDYFREK